jgi:hypothetical protein
VKGSVAFAGRGEGQAKVGDETVENDLTVTKDSGVDERLS